MPHNILLFMKGIEIMFPGVKALDKVDFELAAGEIHALLGENGAGKSTLIKCLTGVHRMDKGEITMENKHIAPTSPQNAMELGISTVYQEINLCPNLTVAENIFVGRQPMKHKRIDWKTINQRAEALLERFNIHIDVTRPLAAYSTGIQQMVSIARAVDVKAKILILDEPTSSLDDNEVKRLFDVMRDLKQAGMGIIFITHFLDQVFAISDRITVLRNGLLVGVFQTKEISKIELVTQMIGKDMDVIYNLKRPVIAAGAKETLSCEDIGITGSVHDVSIRMKEGELLGFAGLFGSGRTETAEMLFGVTTPTHGMLYLGRRKGALQGAHRRHQPQNGVLPGGPQTRRHHRRLDDTGKHHPGAPSQAGFSPADSAENPAGNCGSVYQNAQYRHARRGEKGGRAQRRQPAEGDFGTLDGHAAGYHDYGRAHTRDRHRRQGRNPAYHAEHV